MQNNGHQERLGEEQARDRAEPGLAVVNHPAEALIGQATRLSQLVSSLPATVLSYISPAQVSDVVETGRSSSSSPASVTSEGPRARRLAASARSALKAPAASEFGFSFAPAGLLFPYHLGVAVYLQHIRYLTPQTPIMGSSAGALVVACVALELDPHAVWKMLYNLESHFTLYGTRGKMRRQVRRGLQAILPADAHTRLNSRPQPAYVIYTAVKGASLKARYCGEFSSRDDLISCLLASCNIPMYFTNRPFISVRQDWAVDGYFSDVRNFGCPPFHPYANAKRQIRVLPFEAARVLAGTEAEEGRGFPTDAAALPRLDYIAPDLCCYDHLIDEAALAEFIRYVNEHRALSPEAVGERRFADAAYSNGALDHPLYAVRSTTCAADDAAAAEDVRTTAAAAAPAPPPADPPYKRHHSCGIRTFRGRRRSYSGVTRLPSVELPGACAAPQPVQLERRASEPSGRQAAETAPSVGEEEDLRIDRLASLRARSTFEAALEAQFRDSAAAIEMHDNSTEGMRTSQSPPTAAADYNFFHLFASPKKMWASLTHRLLTGQDNAQEMSLEQVTPLQPWGFLTKRRSGDVNASSGQVPTSSELPFCRFSWGRLLQLALRPAQESRVVVELFELGRADAFRWHQLILRNSAGLERTGAEPREGQQQPH